MLHKKFRVSNSLLNTYDTCPFKYKCHYVDKLAHKFEQKKSYFSLGSSIHKTLSRFFKEPQENRTKENMISLLRKSWEKEGYANLEEERKNEYKAVNMLEKFYNNLTGQENPIELEKWFSIDYKDFQVNGIIDRVDKTADGYEIIDYKTSSYLPDKEDLLAEFQLYIYAFAAYNMYDLEDNVKLTYYYLPIEKIISFDVNKETVYKKMEEISQLAEKIRVDNEYKPKKNIFCDWCDYKIICPIWTAGETPEVQLYNIMKNLYTINQATQKMTTILNLKLLYKTILDIFREVLGATRGTIFIYDNESNRFKLFEAYRIKRKKISFKIGEGIAGDVARKQKPEIVKDITSDPRFTIYSNDEDKELEKESLLIIPLIFNKKTLAIVNLNDKHRYKYFSENDMALVYNLSNIAVAAISNAMMYERAITDGMTGLYIHSYFETELESQIENARKYNTSLSLIMMDIDHFKEVNDTYGHQVGDIVLKDISKIIRQSVRDTDIAARYGGEEFSIILPEVNVENAFCIAERIRTKVEEHEFDVVEGEPPIKITISAGIACLKKKNISKELIKFSDKALYLSKDRGRNISTIYNEDDWQDIIKKIYHDEE